MSAPAAVGAIGGAVLRKPERTSENLKARQSSEIGYTNTCSSCSNLGAPITQNPCYGGGFVVVEGSGGAIGGASLSRRTQIGRLSNACEGTAEASAGCAS